ncbi:FMN-binding negative transcriptional regulator [Halocynthiibacter namhaensis]|uniref:FMN-binding negative transcriptional regulator n=1 Tax=Halocynthiibacter namhaensis TaxID=1290553 RepID=UPI000579841C|nr:FMN-binding negative transcriptional regulator [Halocynthiibacter namhaensis]
MHPNPAFRQTPNDQNITLARDRGFGVLSVNGADGPLISHVPFILSKDGGFADLHLVRSNPIVRALAEPQKAVIAVTGPDAYISPDWYGIEDQVPTWNYVAVHLRGELYLRDAGDLKPHLDELTAHFEARLLPKPPWKNDKVTPDAFERMLRMIVPVRLKIETVDGTWKLGQNKGETARLGAADGLDRAGFGNDVGQLAQLMRSARD